MSKMSASVLGGATLLLATAVAEADENCKVEDWRWYIPAWGHTGHRGHVELQG